MNVLLNDFPDMVITGEVKDTVILGLPCYKTFAEFQIDSVPAVALYYTKAINVKNPNWINKYQQVDGFLLGYDIEQFGMRMRLLATDIIQEEFSFDKENIYGKNTTLEYKELEPKALQQEFRKLVQNFSM
jgi:hypothetical protein